MSDFPYIHGFSAEEQERLRRQARFAETPVYQDVDFSHARQILEIGCGVGAQSEILLRRFPDIHLTGVDLNPRQLAEAERLLHSLPQAQGRFTLAEQNAAALEWPDQSFEGAFVCWLLEHVSQPEAILREAKRVLRPGAKIYLTEVMNSSFLLHPYSPQTWKYWLAFNDFQISQGGDPFVGAKLGNLLLKAGFRDIRTESKILHYDNRTPEARREAMEFWTELLLSAAPQLVESNLVETETVEAMKEEFQAVARDPDSVFYYSFIQANAVA